MKHVLLLILFACSSTYGLQEKPTNIKRDNTHVRGKWEVTEAERNCLHLNAYFEGGNDTITAHRGFIETVLNRRASPDYPNDACEVIFQSNAFSWTRNEYFLYESQKHVYRSVVITVNALLEGLQSGFLKEITFGSTHYHADYVTPCWIPDMKLTNRLGRHIFYKQVRKTGACSKAVEQLND